MLLIGRLVRFLIAAVFFAFGYAVAQFANGNREAITVSITPYSFQVPVYLLALVPLGAGLLLGWLYSIPARTHEFADHWRSWRTVRRVEKENKELRRSLDKVLDLPDDGAAGRQLENGERPALKAPALEAALEAEPVVVHEVRDVATRPHRPATERVAKRAVKAAVKAAPNPVRAAPVSAPRPVKPNGKAHPQPEPAPAH